MLNERAVELGRLIGQSDEYTAVRRANDALGADKDAVALLQRMEQLRHQASDMLDRGEKGIIAEGRPRDLATKSRDPRVTEFLHRGDKLSAE